MGKLERVELPESATIADLAKAFAAKLPEGAANQAQ